MGRGGEREKEYFGLRCFILSRDFLKVKRTLKQRKGKRSLNLAVNQNHQGFAVPMTNRIFLLLNLFSKESFCQTTTHCSLAPNPNKTDKN